MAVRDSLVAPVHRDHLTGAPPAATDSLAAAERLLGHRFARPDLLREALTHRSAVSGPQLSRGRLGRSTGAGSNERLEFVGDRVLGLIVAEWLADRFPGEAEGRLGPRLAYLVSQPVLAAIAEQRGLPDLLSVSAGESRAGVRHRATVLADAMEAVIGALYFDAGLAAARAFVRGAWGAVMETQAEPPKDAKTALQEWLLARARPLPVYALVAREGPAHDPTFVVSVSAGEAEGRGSASSKRAAERLAAEDLLRRIAAS